MNFQSATVFFNFVALLLLDIFIQLNAAPTADINSDSLQVVSARTCINKAAVMDRECSFEVSSYPTEGNSLYSHSEIFGNTATPTDVEAFKYFCTVNLTLSTIPIEVLNSRNSSCNILPASLNHEILCNITLTCLMNESTTESICKYYAEIKAYQYKLNNFSVSPNVLNKTIASIMYLLQSAGESLQAIEYSNCNSFCPDIVGEEEEVYDTLVATDHDTVEEVLSCLGDRLDWIEYGNYNALFNTSPCLDYDHAKCQFYTSLYRAVLEQQ